MLLWSYVMAVLSAVCSENQSKLLISSHHIEPLSGPGVDRGQDLFMETKPLKCLISLILHSFYFNSQEYII